MSTTYVIRGWTEEAFSSHEFAHREASRHNTFIQKDYNAKPEEFRFDARSDVSARRKADKDYPDLVKRRELLKVVYTKF